VNTENTVTNTTFCPACGTHLAASLLCCPSCGQLVHAHTLTRLAQEAEAATGRGELSAALASWREALSLLPADSRQHRIITERVTALSERVGPAPAAVLPTAAVAHKAEASGEHKSGFKKGVAGVGALALLLWKFKFALTFILTKGKILLLGLTKASTVFSMLLSLSVYWAAWGWKFALGIVLSIYVHEMGHVAMLRHYGVRASAPMFIPGVGALIRLKQTLPDAIADARMGLAGPMWGLGAAVCAYLVFLATGWQSWAAIAQIGAWINLFNLIPVWQLDGSRGFRTLTRHQRWLAVAAVAVAWFFTAEGMLLLLLIAAAIRAAGSQAPDKPDRLGLLQYVLLIAALSAMTKIDVGLAGAGL